MANKSQPSIKSCKPSENWTSVTFKPDLSKFGMSELEDDTISLMRKRVYDLAGVLGKTVKVILLHIVFSQFFPQSLSRKKSLLVRQCLTSPIGSMALA